MVYCAFTDYGAMQKGLESLKIEVIEAKLMRIPTTTSPITGENMELMHKLIEKLEKDEGVQEVFHNMTDAEE
jgi:transcriptional/translational regulatory protein YebC/TACO1